MDKLPYSVDYISSYRATLWNPLEVISPLPVGIRINFQLTGGKLNGEKPRGVLRPAGGDRFTLRTDGVGIYVLN